MSPLNVRLMIADDEPKYVRSLKMILERKGYTVITASDGQLALELAAREAPALMLLDVRIPKVDGFEICRRIRAFSMAPILMLTALGQEEDIVTGLQAGADDYLVKPFQIDILLTRLETILSWSALGSPSEVSNPDVQINELRISLAQRQVCVGGHPVLLTAAEYQLLSELAHAVGGSVPQAVLLTQVWGTDRMDLDQFVPVFIRRLRQKIEPDPANPQYILSQPDQSFSLGPLSARP
jgi:DNA-binding response OmpR family regulator